jgi:FkbM family methyltransferase
VTPFGRWARSTVLGAGAITHTIMDRVGGLEMARALVRGGHDAVDMERDGDLQRPTTRLRIYAAMFLDPPGKHGTATASVDGRPFIVDPAEMVGRALLYGLPFERHELRTFLSVLRPADIVFDVGANIGLYSFLAANRFPNSPLNVHAFEPNPRARKMLSANTQRRPTVIVHAKAMGASSGEALFHCADDSAFSGLGDTGREKIASTTLVPVTTLDAEVESTGVGKVDVVKVDVEGFEPDVVKGARNTFARDDAPLLLIEVAARNLEVRGLSQTVVLTELRDLGYRVYAVDKRLQLLDRLNTPAVLAHQNFLAVKPSRLDRLDGLELA